MVGGFPRPQSYLTEGFPLCISYEVLGRSATQPTVGRLSWNCWRLPVMSGPSRLLAASAVASVSVSFVSVFPVLHLSLSASICRLHLSLSASRFPFHPRPKAYGRVWLLAASRRGHLSCGRRGSLELVAVAVGRGMRLIMPQRRARREIPIFRLGCGRGGHTGGGDSRGGPRIPLSRRSRPRRPKVPRREAPS